MTWVIAIIVIRVFARQGIVGRVPLVIRQHVQAVTRLSVLPVIRDHVFPVMSRRLVVWIWGHVSRVTRVRVPLVINRPVPVLIRGRVSPAIRAFVRLPIVDLVSMGTRVCARLAMSRFLVRRLIRPVLVLSVIRGRAWCAIREFVIVPILDPVLLVTRASVIMGIMVHVWAVIRLPVLSVIRVHV